MLMMQADYKDKYVMWTLFILFIFLNTSESLSLDILPGSRHAILFLGVLHVAVLIKGSNIGVDKSFFKLAVITVYIIVFNYLFSEVPLAQYVLGVLFSYIFLIVSLISYNISIQPKYGYRLLKMISFSILILFLHTLILVYQSGSSLRWESGLFRESGAMASLLNIAIIIFLYLHKELGFKKFLFYALLTSLFVIMTTIKKAIVGLGIIWMLYIMFQNTFNKKIKLTILACLTLSIGFVQLGDEIIFNLQENQYYLNRVGYEKHVRLGMYIASINIMLDNFPLGSGYGTFGSLASISNGWYSPLYDLYGVSNIGTNQYQNVLEGHHTLLDTFWPHVLAEMGALGTIFFITLFVYPAIYFYRNGKKIGDNSRNTTIFYLLATYLLMINDGLTLFNPEIPVFIFIHASLSWIVINNVNRKFNSKEY